MKNEIFEFVPRIVRPSQEFGVDWDSPRIVLVRQGHKELVWLQAGKSWANRIEGYLSRPGELMLVDYKERTNGMARTTLHEAGGRLSKKMIEAHSEPINKFFDNGDVASIIDMKKTLVIRDNNEYNNGE